MKHAPGKIGMVAITALTAAIISGCSYHRAHFHLSEHDAALPLDTGPFEGEVLGTVAANEAGAIWVDCTESVRDSLWHLVEKAQAMDANAIGDLRWMPKMPERDVRVPTCKKKWGWVAVWPVLITPAFMSTRVEGTAYRLADEGQPRSGVYRLPGPGEDVARVVDLILADTKLRAAVTR